MSRTTRLSILFVLVLMVLSATFGAGFYLGKKENQLPSVDRVTGLDNKEEGKPADVDFSIFWDGWKVIEDQYVGKGNLDREKMVHGALQGLLGALDDPYSVFFPPDESKKFIEDVSGSFEGIGAEIGMRNKQLTIIAPLKGSPAERAGLKTGDFILRINDTDTPNIALEEAVSKIRGPKGSEVTLLIMREGFDKPEEFKLKRGVIKVPVLSLEMKDGVNYLQLYSFSRDSSAEFRKAVRQIQQSGSSRLVLDLRNNPGGYLDAAQDIASQFIPWGDPIVIEEYGNGTRETLKSRGYNSLRNVKVVVLINEGSASASEILAGALRDNLGVKLVGQKSFGKGSVQDVEELKDGSSVKITIAKWLTPKGYTIAEVGLEPDVKVDMPEGENPDNKDPQLDKALEMVKGL